LNHNAIPVAEVGELAQAPGPNEVEHMKELQNIILHWVACKGHAAHSATTVATAMAATAAGTDATESLQQFGRTISPLDAVCFV
jgi:hypothetical protein